MDYTSIINKYKDKFDHLVIKEYNSSDFINKYYGDYSKEEIEKYSEMFNFLNTLGNAIFIQDVFINENFEKQGITTRMFKELKSLNIPMVLYSDSDAESYWSKIEFRNVDSYVYSHGF